VQVANNGFRELIDPQVLSARNDAGASSRTCTDVIVVRGLNRSRPMSYAHCAFRQTPKDLRGDHPKLCKGIDVMNGFHVRDPTTKFVPTPSAQRS